MIRIVVTSPQIRNMKGVGKTSGKPYDIDFQVCHAFTIAPDTGVVSEFPDKFEIMLDAGQKPYPRGNYTLDPSSVYVSREGRIELKPRLVPVPAAAK